MPDIQWCSDLPSARSPLRPSHACLRPERTFALLAQDSDNGEAGGYNLCDNATSPHDYMIT
jgi:hypothetical protein